MSSEEKKKGTSVKEKVPTAPTPKASDASTEVQKESKAKANKSPLHSLYLNGKKLGTNLDLPFLKQRHPEFSVGDTIRVNVRIREGNKERIQLYEGLVIALRGEGSGRSFIVRRVSHEVGIERIFPYYSPAIHSIEVTRKGRVRRARLYYLRHKSSKEGRIREAPRHLPEKEESIEEVEEELSAPPETQEGKIEKQKQSKKVSKNITKKSSKKTRTKVTKLSKTAAKNLAKKTSTQKTAEATKKVSTKKSVSKKKVSASKKIQKKVAKKKKNSKKK